MKKLLTISLLTSSLMFASEVSIDSVGLNIGKANSDYSQRNSSGSITLGNNPDKTFNTFELFSTLTGLEKYDMKPYISYTYSSNEELKHQYLLLGLNKYYKIKKVDFYAGILLGYGELKYKYNPLNNTKENDFNSSSIIGGIQAGIEYPFNNNLSLNINTKYLGHNYETILAPNSTTSAELKHHSTSSLSIGLKYSF